MSKLDLIKQEIFQKIKEYYNLHHESGQFIPGRSRIQYAGRVFDVNEMTSAIDSILEFWLTEGKYSDAFSLKIGKFLGIKHVLLTNSGSSANLLALSCLTSTKLGERKVNAGDEIITVAAGFPSTVAPIIQTQLVPVYIDVDLATANIVAEKIEKAVSKRTKGIFLAHTLGNPFNISIVSKVAEKYNLWLIEDNCDAFGSRYNSEFTGTFGHIATLSFYPAHHITTGEGGAVVTNDKILADIIRSFRDWGRDCYCSGGNNNTCGKRFSQSHGDLPTGYDHKYIYSEIGYNLKMTDIQAAIGLAQIEKLEKFCSSRRLNFKKLHAVFSEFKNFFYLPEATENSDPAWFAFMITLRENLPFSRQQITKYLNDHMIETRNFFAGNIIRQPAFRNTKYRIHDNLANTDYIMNHSFFIGTYPGLTDPMINFIASTIRDFCNYYG
jgi:CDP-6-deoxy-D-xylo-4-hexulose-3-dehydrase